MKIPFARVACDGNELKYVREVLESGWLTTAGRTFEFEQRFGEATGARHACAVNSCTAALHLGLEAIGVGPGDKVLVPTLTFTATAEVIRYLGADPVFVDVDYGTGLLTPEIVEEALMRHKGVKAVMVVHLGGQAAEMGDGEHRDNGLRTTDHGAGGRRTEDGVVSSHAVSSPVVGSPVVSAPHEGILDVCRRYNVRVIEDAAHAFPTRLNGRMIGTFGDATCFSFYANKTITTGEGGMLVTDDDAIYARVKTMRLHGISRDIWDRFTSSSGSWEYDVVAPGFKYNMPDVNAAIGLAQLERAELLRRERQRCFEYYFKHLAGIDCIDLPVIRGSLEAHSCHLFWIVLKESAPVSRNRLIGLLGEAGIGTSVHYRPLHRMTYYRERYGLRAEDYPNAERHWIGCVSLPVYPGLTEPKLAYVAGEVRRCLGGGRGTQRKRTTDHGPRGRRTEDGGWGTEERDHEIKRAFDLFFSVVGLVVLSPVFLVLAVAVKLSDGGTVLFRQKRVGQGGRPFFILKFRSMVEGAEPMGISVTKNGDARITRLGRFLRKSKLDELPQLWNVLVGKMSFVGPRPEVPLYVGMYTEEQKQILALKPGITDLATLVFRNEEELLRGAEDGVERFYVEYCVPRKIELSLAYAAGANLWEDTKIILRTLCPWLPLRSRWESVGPHAKDAKDAKDDNTPSLRPLRPSRDEASRHQAT